MKLKSRDASALTELFRKFYAISRSGGGLLLLCTVFSLLLANSAWGDSWRSFWEIKIGPELSGFHLRHSITNWINDGLMTLFFLLVGLEIEREMLVGELRNRRAAMLPVIAAIGGMIVPALLYMGVNFNSPNTLSGAGIPTATDIAFALAVIGLLGNRIPNSLKVFLVALAIMDDLGAIVVIAFFYGQGISAIYLTLALGLFLLMLLLKKNGVLSLWIYIPAGILLWFLMLHSGIHPTLAGVLLAFAIPFHSGILESPSHKLEKWLQTPVSLLVVPLFALANTALDIHTEIFSQLLAPVGMGIFLGLVVGKPLGIFLISFLAVKTKIAAYPENTNGKMILGAGMLGGIGFTMAIFVSNLAFNDSENINIAKLAVLISSICAAILGLIYLKFVTSKRRLN
jgi:NhaA family Na+:H+ antiporter